MILTIPVLLAHILIIPIQNASKTGAAIVLGKVTFSERKMCEDGVKMNFEGDKKYNCIIPNFRASSLHSLDCILIGYKNVCTSVPANGKVD